MDDVRRFYPPTESQWGHHRIENKSLFMMKLQRSFLFRNPKKKSPWLFSLCPGKKLHYPVTYGLYWNHYKHPVINQPRIMECKKGVVFSLKLLIPYRLTCWERQWNLNTLQSGGDSIPRDLALMLCNFLYTFLHIVLSTARWTKSCTTKDDDYPIIYKVLTIPGGSGFLPSTICQGMIGPLPLSHFHGLLTALFLVL